MDFYCQCRWDMPHSPDNRWCNIDTSETRLEKRFYTCCLEPGNVLPSSCGPVPSPFENKFDRVVRPNAYPWMAMLIYEKRKRKGPYANSVSKCAGSLINTRYVLTAAHCVTRGESISQGLVLRRVRLGEHDTHKNPDCDHGPPCSAPYVEIDVEYFKVHEAYANTSRFESDIALVRLKVPVRYTKEIQPICLLKDPINLRNMPLLIAGWGQTEVEANSSVLRYATVFEGLKYCKDTSFYRPETQICAGSRYGDNACDGDSGGPMMVSLHHGGEKSMYVAGIISYGYKCDGDTGTFYTVTGTFFKWIKAKLEP
ncbi:uncharacterized protein Dere_GG12412 [Drosophila erecta]|uniref:GG12412 n=1 Tax=Drosophila erecta TaxID=7220 RepID=B3P8F2_DROER|nr:uncharacterized protein Dere_GG12412 [Drosophila erecta]